MTLAFEDAYSKLVEVVTLADVDDEDRVGNSLLQIDAEVCWRRLMRLLDGEDFCRCLMA